MATLYHQIWIDAPIDKVYAAISSPDGVSTWWDKQTRKQTPDGEVWEHSPGPEHGTVKMLVLDLVPNERVVWKCISEHPAGTPAQGWTDCRLVFDLTPKEDFEPANKSWAKDSPAQTILQFRQTRLSERDPYFGFVNSAWGQVLENLRKVVTQ